MTWLASSAVFGALVFLAIAGVAIGAGTLLVLIVRDWRSGRLW